MTTQQVLSIVRKALRPIQRRAYLMVARAIVELVDDSKKLQALQVSMGDEVHDDVERFQQYGITSIPAKDAEAMLLAVGGGRSHAVVVAVDDRRYRPTGLARGEVALYTLQNAIRVLCKDDGSLRLGTDPVDNVALATNTESRLTALEAFALTHAHPGVMPGPSLTGPAPGAPTSSGPVAATEVFAK